MSARIAIPFAVATLLGGCTPYAETYSYSVRSVPAAPYAYAPGPYYSEPYYPAPAYVEPYVAPGPTVIVGGERRYYDDRRYRDRGWDGRERYERRGPEGYRGAPPQAPGRQFGQGPGRGAPPPSAPPVIAPRPAPGPGPGPSFNPANAHDPAYNPANPTAQGGGDR